MAERNSPATPTDRQLLITRVFDAPRNLVFKAWTDPKHLSQWFGPRGFTNPVCELDVRPGGAMRIHMRGPDGTIYPMTGVFQEIVQPERLVFTSEALDKKGKPLFEQLTILSFAEQGGKTILKVDVRVSKATAEAAPHLAGMEMGWNQTLDRLSEHVSKMGSAGQEFVISRVFDAPRELVWKAWTERDRLMKWFGPKGFTMRIATLDLRPGGVFHYCLRSPGGQDMWGKFVYREISPPEKIVLINSFSDEKGNLTRHPMSPTWPLEMLSTTTLAEQQGKTTVTIRWSPLNATEIERKTFDDAHAGMNQGWGGTFDQLAEYLAKA